MARGSLKSDLSKADRGNDKPNLTKKQAREAQRSIDNSRSEPERDMVKELTEKKSWVPKDLQDKVKALTPDKQTELADHMLGVRRQFEKDGTSAYDIYEEEMESQEDADAAHKAF